MARIKTYDIDTSISSEDKVVGTDGNPGNNFGKTKNFTVGALSGFIRAGVVTQTTGTVDPSIEAGITGASYIGKIGHWTRTGNMVDVHLFISTTSFSISDPSQVLKITNCIPYAVEGSPITNDGAFFFMGTLLQHQNISNNGVEFPSLFLSQIKTNISGTDASTGISRPSGYSTAPIITSNLATEGLVLTLSFRYRCRTTETLLPGATKN